MFQPDRNTIRWKLHFSSPREVVFEALSTEAGRARFWAEAAPEVDGEITFNFLNHEPVTGRVIERDGPGRFIVEYFESVVEFSIDDAGSGGADLTLVATGVDDAKHSEVTAGWVSVLMAMKAAVDFDVDLRNHDDSRTWSDGYADN